MTERNKVSKTVAPVKTCWEGKKLYAFSGVISSSGAVTFAFSYAHATCLTVFDWFFSHPLLRISRLGNYVPKPILVEWFHVIKDFKQMSRFYPYIVMATISIKACCWGYVGELDFTLCPVRQPHLVSSQRLRSQ